MIEEPSDGENDQIVSTPARRPTVPVIRNLLQSQTGRPSTPRQLGPSPLPMPSLRPLPSRAQVFDVSTPRSSAQAISIATPRDDVKPSGPEAVNVAKKRGIVGADSQPKRPLSLPRANDMASITFIDPRPKPSSVNETQLTVDARLAMGEVAMTSGERKK